MAHIESEDILYDVFYRLNTGSVPLSTQELRQVLHRGPFADYLIECTDAPIGLHKVLGLSGPDPRLRDAEIVLRFIALVLFPQEYRGNLKAFLDYAMKVANADWGNYENKVKHVFDDLDTSVDLLNEIFSYPLVGRKFVDGGWESRFNRVLFEVEAFYFRFIPKSKLKPNKQKFLERFKKLCSDDRDFRASIEATTKTNERYEIRFRLFQKAINASFGLQIDEIPVRA